MHFVLTSVFHYVCHELATFGQEMATEIKKKAKSEREAQRTSMNAWFKNAFAGLKGREREREGQHY